MTVQSKPLIDAARQGTNKAELPCGASFVTCNVTDLFVSIDLSRDVAYVVHECDSGLNWQEIPRLDGELLIAMGAHSLVTIPQTQ